MNVVVEENSAPTGSDTLIWRGGYELVDENGKVIPPDKSDWDYTSDEDKCMYNEAYCKVPGKVAKKGAKKAKKKKHKKEKTVKQVETVNETHEVTAQPEQHTAVVSVPSAPDHLADLKSVVPSGGNDMVTVILSGIAVMGGATAWKFYSQRSANAHEERMKKLELDSQSNSNHQVCSAANAALAARIEALEAKVSKVESNTVNLGGGGLDDIEERLTKVEKLVKKPKVGEKKVL